MVGDWPKEKGGGHLNRLCGLCVSPTAKKSAEHHEAKRTEYIERNKARRARIAAEAGKQYRTREQINAGVPLDPSLRRYPEGRHMAALKYIARVRTQATHSRNVHDAHVRAFNSLSDSEKYRWQYRNDATFSIHERLRRQLRKKAEAVPGVAELISCALKREGNSNKVEALLGYAIADLKRHLERQFTKGMSWDVWSKDGIHIDHILPRKCFDLTSVEGIQAYWALSNLRPLWAKANLEKQAKVQFLC